MPTHVAENSASPALCCVAVGTVHEPSTLWNCAPPFSRLPWLYPDQLFDLFAPTFTIGRWNMAAVDGDVAVGAIDRNNRLTQQNRPISAVFTPPLRATGMPA